MAYILHIYCQKLENILSHTSGAHTFVFPADLFHTTLEIGQQVLPSGTLVPIIRTNYSTQAIMSIFSAIIIGFSGSIVFVTATRQDFLGKNLNIKSDRKILFRAASVLIATNFLVFGIPAILTNAANQAWGPAGSMVGFINLISLYVIVRISLMNQNISLEIPSQISRIWKITKGHWWFSMIIILINSIPFLAISGILSFYILIPSMLSTGKVPLYTVFIS